MKLDQKEVRRFKDFAKKFDKRMDQFLQLVTQDVAEMAMEEVFRSVPDPEFKHYLETLEVVSVEGTNDSALISNELIMSSGDLNKEIDVLVFVQKDPNKVSPYGDFLIVNSPFVIGFVTEIPEGIEPVMRRATKFEREEVLEDNLTTRGTLNELRIKHDGQLNRIKEVHVDVLFSLLRLEYGLPGYPHRPHWAKVAKEIKRFADKAVTNNELFGEGKLNRAKMLNTIDEKKVEELKDFEKKII